MFRVELSTVARQVMNCCWCWFNYICNFDFTDGKVSPPRRPSHPLHPPVGSSHKVGASVFLTTPHVGQLYHITLSHDPFSELSLNVSHFKVAVFCKVRAYLYSWEEICEKVDTAPVDYLLWIIVKFWNNLINVMNVWGAWISIVVVVCDRYVMLP